jgi:hypothetical protein
VFLNQLSLLTFYYRAFSSMLKKDCKHHSSDQDEEIPEAATTTDDAAISYQADINTALDARNQGQNPMPTAEGEEQDVELGESAETPEVGTT